MGLRLYDLTETLTYFLILSSPNEVVSTLSDQCESMESVSNLKRF